MPITRTPPSATEISSRFHRTGEHGGFGDIIQFQKLILQLQSASPCTPLLAACLLDAISIIVNSVSTGMDMAGLCPKYINIIRGSYIMALIGFCSQPWQLLANATKFLSILSGFEIFVASLTGIMLADYHSIRRQKLKLSDFYSEDPGGIYWYWHGFNLRALVAFISGMWPLFPGLIASVNKITHPALSNWIRLSNLTFFVSLIVSFVTMTAVCCIWPPQGLGDEAPFVDIRQVHRASYALADNEEMSGGLGRVGLDGEIKGALNDGLPRALERVV